MFLNPEDLKNDLHRLEEIEKTTLRIVTQAIYDYRELALEIFREEGDLVSNIAEDITREALDRLGIPKIDQRLFGRVDYKRACYLFQPDYAIRQALFVDSKAEKVSAEDTITLQISQLSMTVKQIRSSQQVVVQGKIPPMITLKGETYLTTTIFVKYNYGENDTSILESITIAAVPNGMLQDEYNPNPHNSIWIAGRNAPSRGEEFRVRLSLPRLKRKAAWRVQNIPMPPNPFHWNS